ncbi:SCP2 sterol-binding domain-containing protein [Xanthovirga aplysinae]|uniref:SCP2 sterol-binding domain-containing protein n=1 Tax=Xanthovirga aplysinae TaxID=2529853 RepID=UPI0012BC0803|nr:SCP2 sterol-binding domain-containing protein [Xanthovirga aplysinae]MTI33136.1 SCP2 sterol-binding domain-containing protein [Xanthovirga aplysinae]
MTFEQITEEITKHAERAAVLGAKLKLLIDDQAVFIDGTGEKNVVSNEDAEADCVIITSQKTLLRLKDGSLKPMMAVMTGKVKIKGNMGLAMKLESLL